MACKNSAFTEDKTHICYKSTGPLNLVVMHYTSETKSMELSSYCSLFMEVCWWGKRATTHRQSLLQHEHIRKMSPFGDFALLCWNSGRGTVFLKNSTVCRSQFDSCDCRVWYWVLYLAEFGNSVGTDIRCQEKLYGGRVGLIQIFLGGVLKRRARQSHSTRQMEEVGVSEWP